MKLSSDKLLELARDFTKEYVSKFKGILGAIMVGSASFGVCDELTDIDILVYASEEVVRKRKAEGKGYNETYQFRGLEVCVDWDSIEKLKENISNWKDDESLWIFRNAKIIYDPKGIIKKVLGKIKHYPEELRKKKAFLHFYCLKANLENCKKMILRREIPSAAFLIYKAIDELSCLTFILEDCFVPYPKWRLSLMRRIPLGRKLLPTVERTMCIKRLNKEELKANLEKLNEIVEFLKPYIRKAGVPKERLGSNWWKYEPDWGV